MIQEQINELGNKDMNIFDLRNTHGNYYEKKLVFCQFVFWTVITRIRDFR